MSDRKRIYLCLAHMSERGMEQKYIQETFFGATSVMTCMKKSEHVFS